LTSKAWSTHQASYIEKRNSFIASGENPDFESDYYKQVTSAGIGFEFRSNWKDRKTGSE
jgi:hypothetical protein